MGYGFEKPKLRAGHHRWIRKEVGRRGRPKPVALGAPLPSDFCSYCQVTREQLEVSI